MPKPKMLQLSKGMTRLFKSLLPLFCGVTISFQAPQPHSINEILGSISAEDRRDLTQLFQSLLFENQFAYTLFGSKPITHKGVFFDTDSENFIHRWQTLKKYLVFVNETHSNFAFLEKTYPELFEIHFVNKQLVLDTIERHAPAFREVLGNLQPNEILARILTFEDLFEAIGNSQILYGVLLGYGEENARGFDQNLPNPKPFNEDYLGQDQLTLPYFQTFSERERLELKSRYQSERNYILSLYSKGNFLEITLTKLLANE
jgi:hypothetical protein